MQDKTMSRLGGTLAIVVGISYVVVGIAYLLTPAEQKATADIAGFLTSFAQSPTASTVDFAALAISAVLALGVVPAVSDVVRAQNPGWVRWTSTVASVGFAVAAIQYARYVAVYPGRAAAYVAADPATQAALAANQGMMELDPHGWLVFGGVGLWSLVINLLALRAHLWPKVLVYVGLAGVAAYWLEVAGNALEVEALVAIAAAGAVVLGPIWYVWVGLILRRGSS
jgi:hypothetical protein